jgi:non-heme chloroperoxidase
MRLLKRTGPRATPPITPTNAKGRHHAIRHHLALDQDVVLAGLLDGHRRGNPVPRYVRVGRVSKAMLLGVIPPFLLQTEDNPKGVPGSVFEEHQARDRG